MIEIVIEALAAFAALVVLPAGIIGGVLLWEDYRNRSGCLRALEDLADFREYLDAPDHPELGTALSGAYNLFFEYVRIKGGNVLWLRHGRRATARLLRRLDRITGKLNFLKRARAQLYHSGGEELIKEALRETESYLEIMQVELTRLGSPHAQVLTCAPCIVLRGGAEKESDEYLSAAESLAQRCAEELSAEDITPRVQETLTELKRLLHSLRGRADCKRELMNALRYFKILSDALSAYLALDEEDRTVERIGIAVLCCQLRQAAAAELDALKERAQLIFKSTLKGSSMYLQLRGCALTSGLRR